MAKEKIAHAKEAIKADGTVDHAILEKHAKHAFDQIRQGHYSIMNPGQATASDSAAQAELQRLVTGLGLQDTLIWFVRREN